MEAKLTPSELLGPRIAGLPSRQVQIHWEFSPYFKLKSVEEVCAEICVFRFCTQDHPAPERDRTREKRG